MLRIPAPGRIEDRTIDGSANPYLAAAAVLAAGLDGIENGPRRGRAELGEPLLRLLRRAHRAAACGRCPRTCSRRSASSSSDDVLREALGRGRGEDYVDYYARVKRDEWFRYHEQVTDWELREYLTRF